MKSLKKVTKIPGWIEGAILFMQGQAPGTRLVVGLPGFAHVDYLRSKLPLHVVEFAAIQMAGCTFQGR